MPDSITSAIIFLSFVIKVFTGPQPLSAEMAGKAIVGRCLAKQEED
jgi:hypothetical protein